MTDSSVPANSSLPRRKRKRKTKKPRFNGAVIKPVAKVKSSRDLDSKVKNLLGILCPICLQQMEEGSVSSTVCGHIFCTLCINQVVKPNRRCPVCYRHLRGINICHTLFLTDDTALF